MSYTTDPNTGVKYRNINGSSLNNYTLIIYARATTGSTSYGEPFFEFLQTTNNYQRILNVTRFSSTTPITLIISNSGAITNTGVTLNTDHLYIITLHTYDNTYYSSFKYTLYRYTTASQTVTQLYQTFQGSGIYANNFNQFWLGRSSIYNKYLSGQYNRVGLYYGDITQNNPTILLRDYVASADGNIFSGDKYVFYAQHNFMGVVTQTFNSPQVNNNRILLSSTNYMNILGIYANASSAPANFAATIIPSSTTITLNWNFPTNNGGDSNSSNYTYNITCKNSTTLVLVGSASTTANTTSTQFSGLSFGTSYIFEIIARNISDIFSSPAIIYGIPYTIPNAPTIGTAIAGPGSRQATVTWTATAPTNNGGSPIIGYKILAHTESLNSFISGATINEGIINNLTVGNAYFFTVVAVNAAGDSTASAQTSTAITANSIPNAPTAVIADVSGFSGQANVRWTAPVSNNGTDISSYTVISNPIGGIAIINFIARTATVTGLTNGTNYTFTVVATNVVGPSPASIASTPAVIPYTVPSAPTLTHVVGNGLVDLSWNEPSSNGRDISSYVIETSPDSIAWTTNSSTNATTRFKRLTGLTNGTLYYFRVFARSVAGDSSSLNVEIAIPFTVPSAPTLTAVAGNGLVDLSWDAPSSNGRDISSYIIETSINLINWTTNSSTNATTRFKRVSGLTNGTLYHFRVYAINLAGNGLSSNEENAIPKTIPGAPTIGTAIASNAQATINWAAPVNNGGSAITGYLIEKSINNTNWNIDSSANNSTIFKIVTGLTNNITYYFRVYATNVAGTSLASATIQVIPEYTNFISSFTTVSDITHISPDFDITESGTIIRVNIYTAVWNPTITCYVDKFTASTNTWARIGPGNTGAIVTDNPGTYTTLKWRQVPLVQTTQVVSGDKIRISHTSFVGGRNYNCARNGSFAIARFIVENIPITITSPLSLSDCLIWLDASDLSSNNANVTAWSDKSGRGNNATGFNNHNNGTSDYPKVLTNGLNNKTIIDLTANNNYFIVNNNLNVYELTIIVLFRILNIPNADIGYGIVSADTWGSLGYAINYEGPRTDPTFSNQFALQSNNSYTATGVSSTSTINWYILTATFNSNTNYSIFTHNGNIKIPNMETGYAPVDNSQGIKIGIFNTQHAGNASIHIAEVIIYDKSLLHNERQGIESYLAIKWGLRGSLSNTHTSFLPIPTQPIVVTTSTAHTQATITWIVQSDGGLPINYYTITNGSGIDLSSATTSITITGLTNGIAYIFTITATNSSYTSAPSARITVTPQNIIPNAPTSVISDVSGFSGQANVRWTAPASNGGSDISSYTVTSSPAGGIATINFATRTATVTGLTNGTGYTFTVRATNAAGTSAASAASTPAVIPYTVPSAPTLLSAVAGIGLVDLSWNAPSSNGGRDISSYIIERSINSTSWFTFTDNSTNATTRFKRVSDLSNGTLYYFRVFARNLAGDSSSSNVANATPFGIPSAPTNVSVIPGNKFVDLSWNAPLSNGSPIINYSVTYYTGTEPSQTDTSNTTIRRISSLTNGKIYTFTVVATNTVGPSPASTPTDVVPISTPITVGTNFIGNTLVICTTIFSTTLSIWERILDFNNNINNAIWIMCASRGNQTGNYMWFSSYPDNWTNLFNAVYAVSGRLHIITIYFQTTTSITVNLYYYENNIIPMANFTTTFTVDLLTSINRFWLGRSSYNTDPYYNGSYSKLALYTGNLNTNNPTTTLLNLITNTTLNSFSTNRYVFTPVNNFRGVVVQRFDNTDVSNSQIRLIPNGATSGGYLNILGIYEDIPNAPTSVIATPGNTNATVTWTAPTNNGGTAITSYTVTSSPEGLFATTPDGTTTSAIVTGLTNGTAYTFTVVATNAVGSSPVSAASTPVIPFTVPSVPQNLTVIPGASFVDLSWNAPLSTGGRDISSYVIETSPDLIAWTTDSSTNATTRFKRVTGLTNGTLYYFRVFARNLAGDSSSSNVENAIPFTVPSAPTLAAVAGNGLVDLSWNEPSSNGRDISSYIIETSPDLITWTTDSSTNAATRFKQLTGLTNGTLYYFRVFARNVAGDSSSSNVENAIPFTVPNAPTNLTGTAGNTQANLSWDAPTSNGGRDISSYNVISSPAGGTATINFAARTATVTNLTNGTAYTFTVTATNIAGTSAASNAIQVTPFTVPSAPQNLTGISLNNIADLSWNAPATTGGRDISSYIIEKSTEFSPEWIIDSSTNALTRFKRVTGLVNGTPYFFRVKARNLAGDSSSSTVLILSTPPSAPLNLSATAGNTIVDLSWNSPSQSGGDIVNGYIIEKSEDSSSWSFNSSTDASTRFKRISDLSNGITYYFRVYATNAVGNGSLSDVVSTIYTPAATVPNPIESIGLVFSNDRVDLSWNVPFNGGNNIIDYTLDAFIVSSNTLIISTSVVSNFILASGFDDLNGQELRISISARNNVGNSTPTDVYFIPYTVPAQITSIIAIPGDGLVDLSWNAPYNRGRDISSYIIETSTDTSSWTDSSANGSTSFKTVTNLSNGTLYYFRVYAINIAGNGPYSSNVSSTPFQTIVLFTFNDTENVVGGKLYINHNYTQQDISFNWYSSIDNSFTNPVLLSNINNKKYLFIRFEYQNLYIRCIVNYNSNTYTSSSVLIQEKYDPEFFDYNINVYTVGQKQSLFNTAFYYYPDVNTPPVFNIDLSLNKISSFLSLNRSLTIGSNLSVSTYGFESSWRPFGERLLEIVAIKIFGHPKARAAISNDNSFYDIEQLSIKVYDAFNNHRNEFGNYYMGIYDITEPNNNTQFINVSNFNIIFPFYLKGITQKSSNQLFKNGPNVGGSLLVNGEYNIPLLLTFI